MHSWGCSVKPIVSMTFLLFFCCQRYCFHDIVVVVVLSRLLFPWHSCCCSVVKVTIYMTLLCLLCCQGYCFHDILAVVLLSRWLFPWHSCCCSVFNVTVSMTFLRLFCCQGDSGHCSVVKVIVDIVLLSRWLLTCCCYSYSSGSWITRLRSPTGCVTTVTSRPSRIGWRLKQSVIRSTGCWTTSYRSTSQVTSGTRTSSIARRTRRSASYLQR